MGEILRNGANVHDQDTGELVGYINPLSQRTTPLDATRLQTLISGAGVQDVVYNVDGRIASYVTSGVAHTVTYPTTATALITNSLGYSRSVAFDSLGRVVSII